VVLGSAHRCIDISSAWSFVGSKWAAAGMDKYTLDEKIGEGSYAVVYRATKAGKLFAIKALKDDFARCALP